MSFRVRRLSWVVVPALAVGLVALGTGVATATTVAKKLKSDGDQACGASKFKEGVKKYQAGLKDLGVKPVHK